MGKFHTHFNNIDDSIHTQKTFRVKKKHILSAIGILMSAMLIFFKHHNSDVVESGIFDFTSTEDDLNLGFIPLIPAIQKFGFELNKFQQIKEGLFDKNETLGTILEQNGVKADILGNLASNMKGVISQNDFQVGKKYYLLGNKAGEAPEYFVFEPNEKYFYIFNLRDPKIKPEKVEKKIETRIQSASGIIESSLWDAITLNGLSDELADKLESALGWSVDFHHFQPDDKFKVIYEQEYIDNKPIGVGRVLAAYYKNSEKEHFAYWYKSGNWEGYHDKDGKQLRRAFLKAPLRSARITSMFSKSRFHPILKYHRPHFGTDYAAPHGTPIIAVADGVVSESRYSSSSGNFVKIRHDQTYSTQYLHMSRFAKGLRPGTRVVQGQTIGYVGSTGWATGPHVCFRFWKNGTQINHLTAKIPLTSSLSGKDLRKFKSDVDALNKQLETIPYFTKEQLEQLSNQPKP
ncbi:MAG: peptidoglycan DD-metalloendopeptidase family protein [Saprospiraceae bacterium]|nr:peptidoglycan DD-metalloendopeptidase family protein [Saprospiraceae bacterium]